MRKLTKMVPVATPPQKANSGLSKSSVTSKSQAAYLPAGFTALGGSGDSESFQFFARPEAKKKTETKNRAFPKERIVFQPSIFRGLC